MCFPKNITMAIYGGSLTGKTTFSQHLANKHNWRVRHCGDVIRMRARSAGISVSEVGADLHSRVDGETIDWVQNCGNPKIVEGRYLNYVLKNRSSRLVLVRFEANIESRLERWGVHNSAVGGERALLHADTRDAEFCSSQYPGITPLQAHCSIDTSDLSVEGIEQKLRRMLG